MIQNFAFRKKKHVFVFIKYAPKQNKYYTQIAALNCNILLKVSDLLANPSSGTKYDAIAIQTRRTEKAIDRN